MKEIHLKIINLEKFNNEELLELKKELENAKSHMINSPLYEPLHALEEKIYNILQKRKTSKYVWLEFSGFWSGYRSSQRRQIGVHYRKVKREIAETMPKFFSHNFDDNTTNDWSICIVPSKGKEWGTYAHQVDEFLKRFISK